MKKISTRSGCWFCAMLFCLAGASDLRSQQDGCYNKIPISDIPFMWEAEFELICKAIDAMPDLFERLLFSEKKWADPTEIYIGSTPGDNAAEALPNSEGAYCAVDVKNILVIDISSLGHLARSPNGELILTAILAHELRHTMQDGPVLRKNSTPAEKAQFYKNEISGYSREREILMDSGKANAEMTNDVGRRIAFLTNSINQFKKK